MYARNIIPTVPDFLEGNQLHRLFDTGHVRVSDTRWTTTLFTVVPAIGRYCVHMSDHT
jgi:hypothetical protein